MKKLNILTLIFVGLLLTVSFRAVKAQDETAPPDATVQNFNKKPRPNLLAELELSQEQIRQIRRINREKQPLIREAQQRLGEAKRNLDQAIYADTVDESDVQTKLKEVQIAQAEVFKIRSTTEFAVRKILTVGQLVKFREVRQRFTQTIEKRQNQPRNRRLNNPNQRFNNRQLRPNN
ncbi:MAG: periplasmic heavy metal sensor [Acidobacteria bacterium]|jgi:Spy/CpxP family protein refolding chaperone|nr:periplasmic heavy metal sensor [Acidobacteriota bacterium]MBA3784422.1 periplasmic heavy metal sensor [Acidobacteriota bacterium]MBA4123696.1 periplasmic heavy metal sensor [Acidobacteriota bacterium]MBA4182757.1 periplasmic heavy metal sensor [Acidobacteriota bacterium]